MMTCPGTACATTVAHAACSAVRSGTRAASTGVGTQMMTASAAPAAAGSVVSSRLPSARAAARRSWSASVRSARREAMSRSRRSLTSIPMIRGLLPCNSTAVGSPTYPRPTMATDPVVIADGAVSKVTSLVCSWLSRPLTASER